MGTSGNGKSTRPGEAETKADWPAERVTDTAEGLPSFWPARLTEAVVAEARGAPAHAPLDAAASSHPPWERWFERALDQGVEEELAGLGRALMREASEAGWSDDHAAEGGLFDEGEAMLELALVQPEDAHARWRALLER